MASLALATSLIASVDLQGVASFRYVKTNFALSFIAEMIRVQILSTILSYIGVDDLDKDALDFGTIAVFTCDASVSICMSQPFVSTTNTA